MKIPKTIKKYCPYCKKHTEHKVLESKRKTPGSAHPLAKFAKKRTGFGKGIGNKGKYGSKPAVSQFKRTGAKVTKKIDLRFECGVCKKKSVQSYGIRTKRLEIK